MKHHTVLLMIVFLAVVYGAPVHAMPIYWNVFNKEGESALGADLVTYASLADMLGDTNRTSVNSTHVNIVGSGSDGVTYWNVFNKEGESALGADLVTYASLADMLGDTNRTSVNSTHVNIVGRAAGRRFWAEQGPIRFQSPRPYSSWVPA